jgi:pilus assembly protein Flp/PilA
VFAKTTLLQILQDEQGATAVEYGLIVALIVIAMVTTLQGLATETIDMWLNIETRVASASSLP